MRYVPGMVTAVPAGNTTMFPVGIVEYIIGYIGIRYFGVRLWDYRELLWNIDGIICFRSVVSFALMGLVFHY